MKKLLLFLTTITLILSLGTVATAKNTSNDLTQKQALQLALSAREHFWNTMSGGTHKSNTNCTSEPFEYQNLQYVFMCKELGTKTKAVKYLTPVFTKQAIDKGFKNYHFAVKDGKLAVPVGDGDNLLNWKKAKMTLLSNKGSAKTYRFTVPTLDGSPSAKRDVTFVKENNVWKVNQFDAVI
ncbi:IseA DL-endopeptidase inhibitor family protein [Bacillus sp. YC2]|uniref:IseA DL-endopeptidase inhibitor family protein n=1 Tax=Bacillus sp. YC2 TaxID=2861287 RepID=UPI001CA63BD3|nr:IseA DL-endopeptidase inhibitor family protein [Bacillus sp. YC2]MBY8914916.1 IseA DL-endopeptidase inhibitor family protein [Bacillus sp. YC2]